jgi:hypothetical protein
MNWEFENESAYCNFANPRIFGCRGQCGTAFAGERVCISPGRAAFPKYPCDREEKHGGVPYAEDLHSFKARGFGMAPATVGRANRRRRQGT